MDAGTRTNSKPDSLQTDVGKPRLLDMLDYGWRWIGTALSFTVFGIGSLFLGLIVVPLLSILVYPEERRYRWSRAVVGGAMKTFVWFMNGVGVLRYEITGLENVEKDKNHLILANHPSLIDVVFLLSVFPTADCVIKGPLKKNIFTRRLMNGVDYISNDDPVEWLQKCVDRLGEGRSLILFPEGTRTRPGEPLFFKAGAGSVAVRSGAECLPVVITCEPTTLTKAESWYDVPDRRVDFALRIQQPISPTEIVADLGDSREAGRVFNRYLHRYFTRRLEEFGVDSASRKTDALG